jgi:hypothetical protein
MTLNIRKIAVVGGFAVGAALAFAPLASADTLTSTVDSEVALLNSLFLSDTTLAGVPASELVTSTTPGVFDIVNPLDITAVQGAGTIPTAFDYLVYGINPIGAGLASDPGAYNVLNGALTEWSDAYNTELYSLLNAGALIPATDLIGSSETIADAFGNGTGSVSDVATYFYEFGANDLAGYLDLPSFFPALVP